MNDYQKLEKDERTIIHTFARAWTVDSRIWIIGNKVLPFPISYWQVAYYLISLMIVLFLVGLFPFLRAINVAVLYGLIPGFMALTMSKARFDGMSPGRYFSGLAHYVATMGQLIENFKYHSPNEDEKLKIDWWCSHCYAK